MIKSFLNYLKEKDEDEEKIIGIPNENRGPGRSATKKRRGKLVIEIIKDKSAKSKRKPAKKNDSGKKKTVAPKLIPIKTRRSDKKPGWEESGVNNKAKRVKRTDGKPKK